VLDCGGGGLEPNKTVAVYSLYACEHSRKESLRKILLKSKILLNGFGGFKYADFHFTERNLS
jgi:hypothetical protein